MLIQLICIRCQNLRFLDRHSNNPTSHAQILVDYASQIAVLSLFLTVKIFWIFPNHVVNFDQIPDPVNTLPDPGKAITDHGGGVGRGGWGGWRWLYQKVFGLVHWVFVLVHRFSFQSKGSQLKGLCFRNIHCKLLTFLLVSFLKEALANIDVCVKGQVLPDSGKEALVGHVDRQLINYFSPHKKQW